MARKPYFNRSFWCTNVAVRIRDIHLLCCPANSSNRPNMAPLNKLYFMQHLINLLIQTD